ncbi:tetraacyldisaccharide 4'-kinase [Geobacter sp. DSM 9736]|uniref:tetraacyldisaccharide 4'-kinase n=1 Tax=Geobacter sp. DSM 9736 TaxID=1277350 RepID=UPI000B5057CC|nr:tetraacyldisaccharide 4'-kinase [Geobacter sp. DSM 9736]SNB45020.1 lipid-A-disaccharide kinase [Geobacter sp. DSM 9736]
MSAAVANVELYFRELIEGKRQSVRDRLVLALLVAATFPYGLIMRFRACLYAFGLLRSYRLSKPVVSVGNLTVGGTGKTPSVAWIARFFLQQGKRVAVLSRGYGGTSHGTTKIVSDGKDIFLSASEAGDEPYMLAATVPGLMVVIGPDRYRAGRLAEEKLNPDIFILDDGFQHQRLRRDFDILLMDCTRPYGNGRLLPAGMLRENPSAAKRADMVIYTRCGNGSAPTLHSDLASCRAGHGLTGIVAFGENELQPFNVLEGSRVMAFAGIADPASFFDALEEAGVRLITTLAFPDHATYGDEELAALVRLRDASRSQYLLTTEKDAVKLVGMQEKLGETFAVRLEMRFEDDTQLRAYLQKFL